MKEHNMTSEVEVLQYFELNLIDMIDTNLSKRAIVWQDIFDSGVEVPLTTVLDVWKDWTMYESVYNATCAGYDIVFSACWYLDHLSQDWWAFYQCDPRSFANLTETQKSHVLGGHSSMWGERVDQTDFFERVWPRASATAEVLWAGGITNIEDASVGMIQGRLDRFRCFMVQQFDIPASPIEPGYCDHSQRNPMGSATSPQLSSHFALDH
jgi:hexosaminidase